jgi:hypothetical protein
MKTIISRPCFRPRAGLLASALICAMALPAWSIETKVLRDEAFSSFNQGESTGTELLSSGRLRIAPRATELDRTGEGIVWRAAVDPYDGHVFYATGHNGKVFHRKPDGKSELWAKLPEVEALSLAIDPRGGVLVGASPGGKIYRIVSAGKPELFFETREQYVWDMIFDRNGVLYAATGPNGRIFRIRGQYNGEVLYDSDATNVMALALDRDGELLAATQGKAFVLRVSGPNRAYVLYSSQDDECRALTVDRNGTIYVAVNSVRLSSVFDKSTAQEPGAPPAPGAEPSPTPRPSSPAQPSFSDSALAGLSGRSSVVQIQPNGFVSDFWQSPEGPIQAILAENATGGILVGAGRKGRIYRLFDDTNYSVTADVDEPMVMSFASLKDRILFTTADKGTLYEFAQTTPKEGLFLSRPLNAGSTVRWGNLMVDAETTTDSEVSFETRSGNTADPLDRNWSSWQPARRIGPKLFSTEGPVSQYLQYRLTMRGTGATPIVDSVQLFCVETNVAPLIRNLRVQKVAGEADTAARAGAMRAALAARATPPPTQPTDPRRPTGTPAQPSPTPQTEPQQQAKPATGETGAGATLGTEGNSQRFTVSWDVMDPNGDRLKYELSLKAEDESEWKLLKDDLTAPGVQFSTESAPDGRYRFRLLASDAPGNPGPIATTTSLVSRIFEIDNTPPVFEEITARNVAKGEYEILAKVRDEMSVLSSAQYNLDSGKEWNPVLPEDGIFDNPQETLRFRVKVEKPEREHAVSLRVFDREGNVRVEKVLLKP